MKHLIYLLLCFLLLTGCATKRTTQTAENRQEQTEFRLRDSLVIHQLHHELRQQNIRLRHIRLELPDSLGRQAVHSVTEIQVQETSQASDSVIHQQVQQQTQCQTVETLRQTETVKASGHTRRWPWLFSLLGIAVSAGGMLWLFKRRG